MISVIIPNYNHAPFLNQRIDSVLDQTYQDFELIILDDCSTDNSKDIIEQYRNHPKVSTIIYNDVNSGSTFKQWQKGIKLAKGEYIWIAESDDWADKEFLEKLIENIDDNTVISYCQSKRVWSNNEISNNPRKNISINYSGNDFIKQKMVYYNSIENASMAIFSKNKVDFSWFDKIGTMRYCGDWFFWIKLLERGNVVEHSDVLNYFRQHEVKVTNKAKREGLDFTEGMTVLKYIESSQHIKLDVSVIKYWSDVWCQNRFFFDPGITRKTIKSLVKFKPIFIFYLPLSLISKRVRTYLRLI